MTVVSARRLEARNRFDCWRFRIGAAEGAAAGQQGPCENVGGGGGRVPSCARSSPRCPSRSSSRSAPSAWSVARTTLLRAVLSAPPRPSAVRPGSGIDRGCLIWGWRNRGRGAVLAMRPRGRGAASLSAGRASFCGSRIPAHRLVLPIDLLFILSVPWLAADRLLHDRARFASDM